MPYNTPEKKRAYNRKYKKTHREEISEAGKKHFLLHKDKIKRRHHNNYRKYRNAVIEKYGSTCHCCDETNSVFLTAHHLNEDGTSERRKLNQDQWRWLNTQPIRKDICLLCYNCHMAINYYGTCPHVTKLIGGFYDKRINASDPGSDCPTRDASSA